MRAGVPDEIDILCAIDLDAGELFVRAGLDLDLPADHEFFAAERSRWLSSLQSGRALVAVDSSDWPLGFAARGMRDGEAYIEQLSVRTQFMRQGIGTGLLSTTESFARNDGARSLWLTTYNHLPWNRAFYERMGYAVVPEAHGGHEILAVLAAERRWLPCPEERVVMQKQLSAASSLVGLRR